MKRACDCDTSFMTVKRIKSTIQQIHRTYMTHVELLHPPARINKQQHQYNKSRFVPTYVQALAFFGNTELLREELYGGADPNATHEVVQGPQLEDHRVIRTTPLATALVNKHWDTAWLLILNGADCYELLDTMHIFKHNTAHILRLLVRGRARQRMALLEDELIERACRPGRMHQTYDIHELKEHYRSKEGK